MNVLDRFRLDGKSGFITGAARGIGKTLTDGFLDAGANVAVVDIDITEAQKTADEFSEKYKKKVIAVRCDVVDAQDAETMVKKVVSEFGSISFAINNAGINTQESAMEIEPDQFKKVIDVNLNGVFFTAQTAARVMKEMGVAGSIISTASMSGIIVNKPPQTIANYCASKAGVIMLTKALAVEWADLGIRVNSVSPGFMQTERPEVKEDVMEDMKKMWLSMIPAGRIGVPDDLLGIYIYLASDASKYTTGANFIIDGAYTCL